MPEIPKTIDERRGFLCRQIDLVTELTVEAGAQDTHAGTSVIDIANRHVFHCTGCKGCVEPRPLKQRPSLRPADSDVTPSRSDWRHQHTVVYVFALQPLLEGQHHALYTARCGVHPEVVRCQSRNDTVVEHHAVLVDQDTVARATHWQSRHGADVHQI